MVDVNRRPVITLLQTINSTIILNTSIELYKYTVKATVPSIRL